MLYMLRGFQQDVIAVKIFQPADTIVEIHTTATKFG